MPDKIIRILDTNFNRQRLETDFNSPIIYYIVADLEEEIEQNSNGNNGYTIQSIEKSTEDWVKELWENHEVDYYKAYQFFLNPSEPKDAVHNFYKGEGFGDIAILALIKITLCFINSDACKQPLFPENYKIEIYTNDNKLKKAIKKYFERECESEKVTIISQ